MFGVIVPLCNRMFCCIFGWYFYIKTRLKYEKKILLSSCRAFSLSTPVNNSEFTWKKATKCNKKMMYKARKSKEQIVILFQFTWQNNVSLLFKTTCNANNKERKGTIEMVLQARFYFLLSFIWLGYTHKRRLIFTTGKWVFFFCTNPILSCDIYFSKFFSPVKLPCMGCWVVYTPFIRGPL